MANGIATSSPKIKVQMRIGVLDTIAKSVYSDPKVKIREAVANAVDNKASCFIIYTDTPSRTISLFDNGHGITKERFEEIFSHIGYATKRLDARTNSYFGLGLMSVLAFGEKATIITKSKGEGHVIRLEIKSRELFSPDMRSEPLSKADDLIIPHECDIVERERWSLLSDEDIVKAMGTFPSNFTEIILENIEETTFTTVISGDFETELRKILPLKAQKNDPFLRSIQDPDASKFITDIMNNSEFCPTIDVYRGTSEGEKEFAQLWKYYPDFRPDLEFGKADIVCGFSKNKTFAYYYFYSLEDLQERLEHRETGFWIRNKNFLVKEADYLERAGSKRIIQQPLKNWLFGEVFHKNMTDFLIVTRNEYVWDSSEFKEFWEEMRGLIIHLNEKLRDGWKASKEIIDSIVVPFTNITKSTEPFVTYDTLRQMGLVDTEKDLPKILATLNERRIPELEKEAIRIDNLIKKGGGEIPLADNETIMVVIDPAVNEAKMLTKRREENTNRVIVRISPELFSPLDITFLGEQFNVCYVAGEKNLPSISIDSKNRRIYINPFNQDVSKYSLSFIEVYIALELADIFSKDKPEMKKHLLHLLGSKSNLKNVNPGQYLFLLKDELQRRQWSV